MAGFEFGGDHPRDDHIPPSIRWRLNEEFGSKMFLALDKRAKNVTMD
jgi:hypothetical protein